MSPSEPDAGDGDDEDERPADAFRFDADGTDADADADDGLRADGSGQTRADGSGATDASDRAAAFRSDSDYSMSRADELRELYDRKFYAPMQILFSDYRGILGVTIMLFYVLMGTVGVALIPEPAQSGPTLLPAFQDMAYPLGTDGAGRGLIRMIVHSTPRMLQLMIGGAIFSAMLSVSVGTVSGYKMGMTDRVLMTITDTVLTIPGLPLLIVIVAILRPSNPFLIGVILSLNAWAGGARNLRSQVLQIRSEDHVEAGRAMGLSTARNVQKNVLPQLLPLITIGFMSALRGIIFAAVGLYYLNILPTDYLNWGVMLNLAYSEVNFATFQDIHYLMVPLFIISLLGIGTIMTAQAFDRVFNPRLRAKHAKTMRSGGDDDDEGPDTAAVEAMAR